MLKKIKYIFNKINSQFLDNCIMKKLYQYRILTRISRKRKNKKKINIVFVCHRPSIWGSLKTVFENCCSDENIEVIIYAIPNKKELPDRGLIHEVYYSEGAEEYFKNFPCKVMNGYDYDTGKWLNLKQLRPDYVFFQQPYNICRPKTLKSNVVSRYAKICYVHYGILIFSGEVERSVYPLDFFKDVSIIFSESNFHKVSLEKLLNEKKMQPSFFLTGYPRFDNLDQFKNINSEVWNFENHNKFRLLWTPRWCTNEQTCNFFEYKDLLLDYCIQTPEIDFVFRPHPQAFVGLNATGEFPEKEANIYRNKYKQQCNTSIDTSGEYLSTFYSSDCLITDISSIIPEYFLTGKPIIYCNKSNVFNQFGSKIAKGFYWVENWAELKATLDMLRSGKDPLREKREELIKTEFYIPKEGAGYLIKEIIKKDFYNA